MILSPAVDMAAPSGADIVDLDAAGFVSLIFFSGCKGGGDNLMPANRSSPHPCEGYGAAGLRRSMYPSCVVTLSV